MVARIVTGRSLRGALHYNERKVQAGKAELLLAHRFLQEAQDLRYADKLGRFQTLLEKSPQVRTNTVHISLNFAVGEVLEQAQLQAIATAYMERLGFDGQPYLVYRHLDAAHPHLHIVTTNIAPGGKRIDLHNIARLRSEPARKALERAYGLVRAEEQRQAQEHLPPLVPLVAARYGQTETRRTLAGLVHRVTREYNCTTLAELNAVLRSLGVSAERGAPQSRMHQRGGLLYSLLDAQGKPVGVPFKASSLPGKPTLARLEARFAQHKATRAPLREALQRHLDEVLRQPKLDGKAFVDQLAHAGVQVVFRQSAQGQTYGLTFIDHQRRAVFNGSELGKGYGAKALLQRLEGLAQRGSDQQAPLPQATPSLHWPLPPLLKELLQAEALPAYLPQGLKPARKKRRRKGHRL